LLHYNNKAAAAVDYIMFKFDNFSISDFVWTGFIKESSHVSSKKVKLFSGTDQRYKYICYEKFVLIFLVRKPM
jgi:hypothetical protein